MKLFWALSGIDGAIALIVLVFFFAGLGDGSVSTFNIVLWLAILGGLAAILGRRAAAQIKRSPASCQGRIADPGHSRNSLFGLFILCAIILQPRWN